jgi:hypothetical protein
LKVPVSIFSQEEVYYLIFQEPRDFFLKNYGT